MSELLDPLIIVVALIAGLAVKRINYPPMLGFLLAGFVIHAIGLEGGELVNSIANAGVTLLLFTIGLKLKLKDLVSVQVWGVSSLHMVITVGLFAGILFLLTPLLSEAYQLSSQAVWLIAFALSFSSTVFAIKIFDERGDGASLYAKLAIGILIMQDLAAVFYLAFSIGKIPQETALLLLLLIPARPLFERLMNFCGHGELLILFGLCLAFGGAALFEACSVKGDLGALLFGVLLSRSSKASELSKSLMSLKELFLVGFFVSIGLVGVPEIPMLLIALVLACFAILKPVLYYFLFVATNLRARTALFSSLSLYNYSEFGLIVAALAVSNSVLPEQWLVIIALALSFSFLFAVPANAHGRQWYNTHTHFLQRFERKNRLPIEPLVDLKGADIVILGMGRVGSGAYEYLKDHQLDYNIVAVEESDTKIQMHRDKGCNVVKGDATDPTFWEQINLESIKLVMVSLTNHSENIDVVDLLSSLKYKGDIAVIARFPDEQAALADKGCIAFNLYAEAGYGFAEHVCEILDEKRT